MSKSGAWIAPSYSPLPSQPRLRLICLPWAGGSSSIYTEWPGFLEQAGVEVLPVELPGRNARAEEEPYTDVRALAADLAAWLAVESSFLNVPFAIFGHSFGGLCAYELSRALAARQPPQPPALLLVSAAPAPRFAGLGSWPASSISQLSQQELEDYLAKKGSPLPRALCEDPELAAPFLRTIRADYSALEAYKEESPLALPCPIQVFGGLGDIDKDKLEAWWHCSAHGAVGVRMHEGGHFYIQSAAQREKVISHIAEAWDRIGDPEDATLSAVCKLARGVLALPEGEEVEDLARAGLDSLESIGLAAEIRAKLGVGLAPDEVIRRPLARHLARYIDIQLSSAELQKLEVSSLQVLSQAHIALAEASMQSSGQQGGGPDLDAVKGLAAEAVRAAMDALRLAREVKDESGQAFALYLAAHAHFLGQKSSEACRFALQSHSLFRALKDLRMAGAASLTLAQAHYSQERNDQALLAAKEALSLSTTAKDPQGVDGARQLLEQLIKNDGQPATVTPCRRF